MGHLVQIIRQYKTGSDLNQKQSTFRTKRRRKGKGRVKKIIIIINFFLNYLNFDILTSNIYNPTEAEIENAKKVASNLQHYILTLCTF